MILIPECLSGAPLLWLQARPPRTLSHRAGGTGQQCQASQGHLGVQEDKNAGSQALANNSTLCSIPALVTAARLQDRPQTLLEPLVQPPAFIMSSAFILMTVLLCSTVGVAFVLQPSAVEPAAVEPVAVEPAAVEPSAVEPAAIGPHRSPAQSWQSIRRSLLEGLGLRTEPRLAAGGLDAVREQWQRTFSAVSQRVRAGEAAAEPGPAESPDSGNGTAPRCCPITSEVFMKDLGWDSWVIQPASLTVVQCAACGRHAAPCPPAAAGTSQERGPCCQPSSHDVVPFLYMDESGSLVISSVPLPRGCVPPPGAQ